VSDTVRFYIDAKPVDAARGTRLIDALATVAADEAAQVRAGKRMLTDSRGLPAVPESEVFAGAIYRVVSARSSASTT
jgi:hypothetical protein